jgi:hypothetical protein
VAGETGIFSNNTGSVNGVSNFQSGAVAACNVQLDTSADGVTFVAGGAIPSQSCVSPTNASSSGSFQFGIIANYVRVNVPTLAAGQTLNVVYSGRLAPTPPLGTPVSNGQWVNAGEVLWTQHTTLGIGAAQVFATYRLQTITGSTITANANLTCSFVTAGGYGIGFVVPQSGYLNGFTSYLFTAGFPQGTDYINLYVLGSMPPGSVDANTAGGNCLSSLTSANINGGMLLTGSPSGSAYPVSFVGTSSIPVSPWAIPGFTSTIVPASPGAGAEWSFTFPVAGRICIQSVSFKLVASAAAANRVPTLILTVNGAQLVYSATTAQVASATQTYSFSPGGAELVTATTNIFHIVPFNNGSPVCFNSGLTTATIGTSTAGIQAGDQHSAINLVVQQQQDND